ncbi:hypothetical protein B0H17DRAFT_1337342 [Mycena rosella]|uniref:Uncharacterized protein n=1 Tax=Mycena rosella TaxID=1033263 RepID=A0AAD7G638_MYCRO|nr:hypothetical protein B0H17DRAFT_1337342 [Mycena rosella]
MYITSRPRSCPRSLPPSFGDTSHLRKRHSRRLRPMPSVRTCQNIIDALLASSSHLCHPTCDIGNIRIHATAASYDSINAAAPARVRPRPSSYIHAPGGAHFPLIFRCRLGAGMSARMARRDRLSPHAHSPVLPDDARYAVAGNDGEDCDGATPTHWPPSALAPACEATPASTNRVEGGGGAAYLGGDGARVGGTVEWKEEEWAHGKGCYLSAHPLLTNPPHAARHRRRARKHIFKLANFAGREGRRGSRWIILALD